MQSPSANWWWIGAGLVVAAAVPVLEYTTVLPPWRTIPYWMVSTIAGVMLAMIGFWKSVANPITAIGLAAVVAAIGLGVSFGINRLIVDNIFFWPPGVK